MQQDLYEAVVNLIGQYAGDNIHTSAPAKVGNVDDNFHAELTPNLKVTTDDGREIQYPKVPTIQRVPRSELLSRSSWGVIALPAQRRFAVSLSI